MGRLMQTDIPPDDKRGCHSHLARHYDQFDKEAPAFDDLMRALSLDLPVEAYDSRESLERSVAQAEIDPAGKKPTLIDAESLALVLDEEDASASAETDPTVSGSALDRLKQRSKESLHAAGERHLRIKKEITRK